MLKKILGTTGAKLITALLGILILILNSNLLGSEGVGTIGLIVFSIMIIIMVSNLVGGSALIYLAPRHNPFSLLLPSYAWALLMSLGCALALETLGLLPEGYIVHIMLIALAESVTSVNLNYLAGIQRIRAYNLISILQYGLLTMVLLSMYFIFHRVEVMSYVYALYAGAFLALLVSFYPLRHLQRGRLQGWKGSLRELIRYGFYVQAAALLHIFTLRISYFFIDAYAGRAALGVFDVNTKLNDGIWLPGKSIALVQYSAISNSGDKDYGIRLSLQLWKFLILLTILMLLFFISLPATAYTFVFGEGFGEVKLIVLLMSPGVLAMASNTVMAHYFSGTGRHYLNSIGSGIGMLATLAGALTLIRNYGLTGAAVTGSIAFMAVALFSLLCFLHINKTPLRNFIPTRSDYKELSKALRELRK